MSRFDEYFFFCGKLFFVVLFSWCCHNNAYAQQAVVSGFLKDKTDNYPLVDGTVVILRQTDSSLVMAPATTDLNGKFSFFAVPNGKFLLKCLYIGYKEVMKPITVENNSLSLGIVGMTANAAEDQITVTVVRSFTQKGDTTEFHADAFKTNPDATAEDLVTKMPGVTIQNGTVQAQGENVAKVLVDGKPFFGDDPSTVLKNLQAEVIDKIQVFDQLSDQSQFTGFDDGNRTKTINIITKPDKRDGNFGKVYAGYGYDDVYRAGGNVNVFKGDRRISVLGQSNNINEQNFSTDDLLGVTSSSSQSGRGGGNTGGGNGGGSFGRPGGSNDNFLVNVQGGVSKTNAIGLNY
ncbi:MAG TPA: carboxypeptidase regulatory-like domain-containing protein, partial [Cytophagaceae bacterium]|nr:carboxypeptidase regulatory-like domain-containing protein [Cytophagaceae bacterium]